MWPQILGIWGCIPELSNQCVDMTNTSSTYLGIIAGALVGGFISWWIYNRQNKTSKQQDSILHRITKLEEGNRKILIRLELSAKKRGELLERIVSLDQNILDLDSKIRSFMTKNETWKEISHLMAIGPRRLWGIQSYKPRIAIAIVLQSHSDTNFTEHFFVFFIMIPQYCATTSYLL